MVNILWVLKWYVIMLSKDKLFIYSKANSPAFARLPRIYTDRQGRGSYRWKYAPTCLSRFLNISWTLGQNTHPPNSDLKVPFCTNIHWAFGGEQYKSWNIFISDQSNPGPKAQNQLHPKLNFWWRFFDTLKKKRQERSVSSHDKAKIGEILVKLEYFYCAYATNASTPYQQGNSPGVKSSKNLLHIGIVELTSKTRRCCSSFNINLRLNRVDISITKLSRAFRPIPFSLVR